MILIKTSVNPNILRNDEFYKDSDIRKNVEKQLLQAVYKNEETRLDLISDKGNKTPTSYKCIPLTSEPTSISDFEFELINV